MSTYSVVACAEEHATQAEQHEGDHATASVTLRCAWADRHALVTDLLVNRRAWPNGSWFSAPRAQSCGVQPAPTTYTTSDQGCVYVDALVAVTYTTAEETDLFTESLEPTTEFLTADHRHFRWGSGNGQPLIEGEAPGQLIRGLSLVRSNWNLAAVPTSILTLPGCCNASLYTSTLLGLSFSPETLLFNPPVLTRKIGSFGAHLWNTSVKFTVKPQGWNKWWRADTQSWERIYLANEGTPYYMYPLGNFSSWLW